MVEIFHTYTHTHTHTYNGKYDTEKIGNVVQ